MAESDFTMDITQAQRMVEALNRVPEVLRDEFSTATRQLSVGGLRESMRLVPVGHGDGGGRLKASMRLEPVSLQGTTIEGGWSANTPYAAQKEFGGEILPKKGKFLVWVERDASGKRVNVRVTRGKNAGLVKPKLIFARRVYQTAQPYMRPGLDAVRRNMKRAYGTAVKKAWKRALP